MADWLVGVILFWVAAALYFGGLQRDVEGGTGLRQFLGLILTYVIFMVIWGALYRSLRRGDGQGLSSPRRSRPFLLPLEFGGFHGVGARVRRPQRQGTDGAIGPERGAEKRGSPSRRPLALRPSQSTGVVRVRPSRPTS